MTCRFTLAVHILGMLAWVERERGASATSEELAKSINTNPVVVRRVLGDLRRAGLVDTKRGVGGGVTLAKNASQITLRHAYEAIEQGEQLFAGYPSGPNPRCPVGNVLADYLGEVYGNAEESMKRSLGKVTVDAMVRDVSSRLRTVKTAV